MPLTEEQAAWMQLVAAKMGRRPLRPEGERLEQPLGAQYVGEERSAVWRLDRGDHETDDAFNARLARGDVVTRHYSEQEKEDNTLRTDALGQVTLGDGTVPQGKQLFAMDPATGDVVVGTDGHRVAELGPDGRPTGNLLPKGTFVADAQAAMRATGDQRVETTHHSTMLSGAPVASAGMVTFRDGKVTDVSNASGHYRPQFEHLLQAVEALMQSGAMLDAEIVDGEGRNVEQTNPRAFSAWQKVQALQAGLLREWPVILHKMEVADDPMLSEGEQAGIAAYLEQCHKRLDKVEKAAEILRKMGIGPSNRIAGRVQVVSAPPAASGEDFRKAVHSVTLPAGEFLAGTEGAGAQSHPVRRSGPRDALNAEFKDMADDTDLRPEDRRDRPEGTVTERSLTPQERAAVQADLQRQIEEADDALAGLAAPASAASLAGAAAPRGDGAYETVDPADFTNAHDDAGDVTALPVGPGGAGAADAAVVAGYSNVPKADDAGDPPEDDGREESLPNRPAEEAGYSRVDRAE